MLTFDMTKKRPSPSGTSRKVPVFNIPCTVQHTRQSEIRHILQGSGIQPKLNIGQPDDKYELEADMVADQVMRMPIPVIQTQPN